MVTKKFEPNLLDIDYNKSSKACDPCAKEFEKINKKVKAFFPNQDGRGTHMNISCAALVKGAPNKANAIALVDYLLSPSAQEHFTNNTFEFPMIAGV